MDEEINVFEDRLTLRALENKILSLKEGEDLTEEEKQAFASKVDDLWKNHPDVLYRFPRWKKYMAWVAGYQLYDYNKLTNRLVEVPLAKKRRLIFNHLRPFVRQIHSKLVSDVPMPGVVPNTSEDADVEAARVGDKFIASLSEKISLIEEVNDLKSWAILCNKAFLRVFWNKDDYGISGYEDITEQIEDPVTGEVTEKPTGEREEIRQEGDVCIESVSPFHCRTDTLYANRNRWRWFIYGDEVGADELEDEYGLERGSLGTASEMNTFDDAFSLQLQSDETNVLMSTPDKDEEVTGRTVVLMEYWTPNIYVFIAGDKILEKGINDYEEIPFFNAETRLVPISNYERGFTYNESMIKDAIPVQRDYNRQASIISIALDRASKLKIMTPLGSLPSKKMWTNDFGVFIDYNKDRGEPHQFKIDPFPADIQQCQARLRTEFENILSVHPASFGQLPERASHASGTLVNILLEQDDDVLNPMLYSINKALSGAWSLALRIVRDNYDVARLVKFVGEDKIEAVKKFRGADLKGNTDVKVVSQTGLPRSRALRIDFLMKLREVKLLKNDKEVLEMMEFGRVEKIFEDELLHEKMAYKENAMISDNPKIDPKVVQKWLYPLEQSVVHLKIHMRDRLGVKYERYEDNQKMALDKHIEMTHKKHIKEQEAQMKRMAEFERLKKGKTGGKGSEEHGGQSVKEGIR